MEETIEIKVQDKKDDVRVKPKEVEIKSVRRLIKTDYVEEFGVDIGAEKEYYKIEDLRFLFIRENQAPPSEITTCKIIKRNEVDNATLWGTLQKLRKNFGYSETLLVDVAVGFRQPKVVEFGEI